MGASLMEQCRVREEGLRIVNLFRLGRNGRTRNGPVETVPEEEAPANYVPAAAVIRKGQALSGITGRKGRVGGWISWE